MTERTEFLAFMRELDFKYDGKWQNLPDDHPDILKLQKLQERIPVRNKPVRKTKNQMEPVASTVWTQEEEAWLVQNYRRMTKAELGERLNRTYSSVARKCRMLGLQTKVGHRSHSVVQYDLEMNVVAKYPSMKEASVETGVYLKGISMAANGKRKTAGGYIWMREGDEE